MGGKKPSTEVEARAYRHTDPDVHEINLPVVKFVAQQKNGIHKSSISILSPNISLIDLSMVSPVKIERNGGVKSVRSRLGEAIRDASFFNSCADDT